MLYTLFIPPRSTYHQVLLSVEVRPISSILVQVCMSLSIALSASHKGQVADVLNWCVILLPDKSSVQELINTILTSRKHPNISYLFLHISTYIKKCLSSIFKKKKSRSTIKIHFMDQAKFIIICTMGPVQNKPLYKINKHNPCPSFIKKKCLSNSCT